MPVLYHRGLTNSRLKPLSCRFRREMAEVEQAQKAEFMALLQLQETGQAGGAAAGSRIAAPATRRFRAAGRTSPACTAVSQTSRPSRSSSSTLARHMHAYGTAAPGPYTAAARKSTCMASEASAAGEMPELPPAIVGEEPPGGGEPGGGEEEAARPAPPEAAAGAASTVLVVGARSVSFVVLPRASWAECRRRTV